MSDIIYNRTHLLFEYNNKIIKFGYFDLDIEFDMNSDKIFIFTPNSNKYKFNIDVLQNINIYTEKLLIDIYISDLLYNNIPEMWICNICLDNTKNTYCKLLCCNNIFHENCLKKFWKKNCDNINYMKTICPLCRSYTKLDYEKCYYI
jgi:hypothetical protein